MKRVFAVLLACAGLLAAPLASADQPPAALPIWQPSDGDVIRFNVLRKGKPMGTHVVKFTALSDGAFKAETRVDLSVKAGPVKLFGYALESTETWKAGKLIALQGKVDENGTLAKVVGALKNDTLMIDGTAFKGPLPAGAVPASHWNSGQVRAASLVSTEDGEIYKVKVTRKGEEKITVAGKEIVAARYLLDSNIDVDLWYDREGRWQKLSFVTRGQTIEYVLAAPYQ